MAPFNLLTGAFGRRRPTAGPRVPSSTYLLPVLRSFVLFLLIPSLWHFGGLSPLRNIHSDGGVGVCAPLYGRV